MTPSHNLLALQDALLLGTAWTAPPADVTAVGEELRSILTEGVLLPEVDVNAEELYRIRGALVAFGALTEDDVTTGLADLIEVLLPAEEE